MGDTDFAPATENYAERVRESFSKQGMMSHMGAEVTEVRPGYCEVVLPHRPEILQQHGFFHGGALASIVDTAGGYAAFSLFDADDGILTVEFKINCLAPARGEKLLARGEVVKLGRTLTVTKGEVIAVEDGNETVCGLMQQTLMRITGRDSVKG
ncbi:MAG: PaaI family thioesterase [Rhodospirillaceae bacterium]|jgi:uncharacterized protein (TIGR00369 family)|nr:PaaI family thioesterase [Rhodospirillaceae bacterium]